MKITMKNRIITLATTLILSVMTTQPASATINIFVCEPEWGALAQELGGDRVSVYTATTALQDPHTIQARPALIAKMRQADLLICTGSELETGWLPVLLRQSGNDRVRTGQPGHFVAADYVVALDIPNSVDRSQGDVHPGGNPHIQTDPRNIGKVAGALFERLQQIDAPHSSDYAARYRDFDQRWQTALTHWTEQAAALRGTKVVVHHKDWAYLFDWLGLQEVATLEPKPGIPPGAGHLSKVLATLRQQPAKMVIRSVYQDSRPSEWLAKRAHIPAVSLPFTVGGSDAAKDLFGLYEDTITTLLKAAK